VGIPVDMVAGEFVENLINKTVEFKMIKEKELKLFVIRIKC